MQFIEVCLTFKHDFLESTVNVMLANLNFFLSQGLHQSYEDWLIHQSQVIGTTENMNHLSFLLYPLGWAACFYVSFLSLIHSLQGNLPAPLLILDADQGIEKMLETYEKFTVTLILPKKKYVEQVLTCQNVRFLQEDLRTIQNIFFFNQPPTLVLIITLG